MRLETTCESLCVRSGARPTEALAGQPHPKRGRSCELQASRGYGKYLQADQDRKARHGLRCDAERVAGNFIVHSNNHILRAVDLANDYRLKLSKKKRRSSPKSLGSRAIA